VSFCVAVAGKGGSGKTSTASLIVRYLKNNGRTPILAIDADPNTNFGESLGLEVNRTVGSVLEYFQDEQINIPAGMTKQTFLDYKLNEAIVESKGLDLLAMGRGAGPECYCYPNHVLREFANTLSANYDYVVMDNEAGMEHLSRGTTQYVDELLIIAAHSVKGVRAAARIRELVLELKLAVKRYSVVVNLVPGAIDPVIAREMDKLAIEPIAAIPFDSSVPEYDLKLMPLLDLPDTSVAVRAVNNLMDKLLG